MYEVTIEELKDDKWVPFETSVAQLDFQMIDPYHRIFLKHKGDGKVRQ